MKPYEFCAIDKNGFKDWIKRNIQPESFQVALCAMIDSVESVTARTSIRGKWIDDTENTFTPSVKCSVCDYNIYEIAGENVVQPTKNYCPNCGAKMDLED